METEEGKNVNTSLTPPVWVDPAQPADSAKDRRNNRKVTRSEKEEPEEKSRPSPSFTSLFLKETFVNYLLIFANIY